MQKFIRSVGIDHNLNAGVVSIEPMKPIRRARQKVEERARLVCRSQNVEQTADLHWQQSL